MRKRSILTGAWKWGLLALVAAAVTVGLMLTRGGGDGAGPAEAQDGPEGPVPGRGAGFGPNPPDVGGAAGFGPGVDFSIGIPEQCATWDSDEKKCLVDPGDNFTLAVFLKDIDGLPDKGDKDLEGGYWYVAVRVDYSWNLSIKKGEGGGAGEISNTAITAPPGSPCFDGLDFATNTEGAANQLHVGCEAGDKGGADTYTGLLFEVDFACPPFKSAETITLVDGPDVNMFFTNTTDEFLKPNPYNRGGQFGTHVWDENNQMQYGVSGVGFATTETLVVNCDNYFPWDIVGDGQVPPPDGLVDLFNDIFEVADHFDEHKPTPHPTHTPTPIP